MDQSPSPAGVDLPHVLCCLALQVLVELLVSVAFPVVEVSFVESIAVVTTEVKVLLKVFKHCLSAWITADLGPAHDVSLDRD